MSARRISIFGVLLSLLVLSTNCISDNSQLPPPRIQAITDQRVFYQVYALIVKHYAEQPPSTMQLVSAALSGMEGMLASKNKIVKPSTALQGVFDESSALITLGLTIEEYSKDTGVDLQPLVYAAVEGMLKRLDAGSTFFSPSRYQELTKQSKAAGVGLELQIKQDQVVVATTLPNTQAQQVGIYAGDHVTKIDNERTKDMTLGNVVNRLVGPEGTLVTITIERKGLIEPISFSLKREIINRDLFEHRILENQVGYVRINQFFDSVPGDLSKSLVLFQSQSVRGFILDLRNNPGGIFTSCLQVAEQFMEPDKLIVSIRNRRGKDDFLSRSHDKLSGIPMVVLVNEGSEAGSEIVAGALQDAGRAVIIGRETLGRGSIQSFYPLVDGSALRLTVAKAYTPKGQPIEHRIQPDLTVEERQGEDRVLSTALEKLKSML